MKPTTTVATLLATEAELALLADIGTGLVCDDPDGTAWLNLGVEGQAVVSEGVWALYRRGWVHQREGERLWRLTFRGRDVMQGRTDG